MQVPREYREALALTDRVRLALEADHVAVRPDGLPGDTAVAESDRRCRRLPCRLPSAAAIEVRGVNRSYGSGPAAVHALRDVSFDVAAGTLVALVGRSGSGKTTLLNVIGGLDRPGPRAPCASPAPTSPPSTTTACADCAASTIALRLPDVRADPRADGGRERRRPAADGPAARAERRAAGRALLDLVGLAGTPSSAPTSCPAASSSGSRSRGRWRRRPRLLLADEPTGQLDAETGLAVMALLRGVVEAEGVTVVVATHDPVMIALADRVLRIRDGSVERGRVPA